MSIDARRRYASAAFVTLLILSVSWPSPVVSINRLWIGAPLAVDELSFLGREAPSWDAVFWCIAGLIGLAIVQSGDVSNWRATLRQGFAWRPDRALVRRGRLLGGLLVSVLVVAFTWFVLDAAVLAWAEMVQSDASRSVVRMVNRFGGGMNPPLVVLFFALAGVAYAKARWVHYAAAMAIASIVAGLIANVLKLAVGRTRPELWLGPFHFAGGGANSFPSGHTVGAFALAGVLLFASRNLPLRVIALVLAAAVGIARVMAFRHWSSDAVASACLGLLVAWIVVKITMGSELRFSVSSPARRENVAGMVESLRMVEETENRSSDPRSGFELGEGDGDQA